MKEVCFKIPEKKDLELLLKKIDLLTTNRPREFAFCSNSNEGNYLKDIAELGKAGFEMVAESDYRKMTSFQRYTDVPQKTIHENDFYDVVFTKQKSDA